MRHALKIAAAAGLIAAAAASPAAAKCTRLAFSVNDYGKDGPTKDAKVLLDKYVAQWTSERGIKSYRTGKKDVKCELFLDFVVFDEHTCRAEATVCWDEKNVGPAPGNAAKLPDGTAPIAPKAKPAPKVKAAAPVNVAPLTTGTVPAAPKPAVVVPSAAPAPVAPPAPPAPAPVAPPTAKPDSAG